MNNQGSITLEGRRLSEALDNHTFSNSSELLLEIDELERLKDELLKKKLMYKSQLNCIKYELLKCSYIIKLILF